MTAIIPAISANIPISLVHKKKPSNTELATAKTVFDGYFLRFSESSVRVLRGAWFSQCTALNALLCYISATYPITTNNPGNILATLILVSSNRLIPMQKIIIEPTNEIPLVIAVVRN